MLVDVVMGRLDAAETVKCQGSVGFGSGGIDLAIMLSPDIVRMRSFSG